MESQYVGSTEDIGCRKFTTPALSDRSENSLEYLAYV